MTAEIKQQILVASRVLYAPNGITDIQEGFSGHVSYRIPPGDKYIVTGHTHVEGRSTLDIGYDDLVTVDIKTGARVNGTMPLLGENVIHSGVYKARPDVNCVIHVHPFWSTVLSLVEKPVLGLPVFFSGKSQVESEADGDALGKALGESFALLIPGHGVVVAADTIEQALVSTVFLETQSKKLYHASLMGEIPDEYLKLNTKSPKATKEGDSMLWYIRSLKERGLFPELPTS
ncbi:MAG: class II aldolase/adducin family protein [Candidatus Bathyarchaeota archaeon]|nr:class II aldolase/adducin family protein [Candidatus Bathyarchaeota archaeon]